MRCAIFEKNIHFCIFQQFLEVSLRLPHTDSRTSICQRKGQNHARQLDRCARLEYAGLTLTVCAYRPMLRPIAQRSARATLCCLFTPASDAVLSVPHRVRLRARLGMDAIDCEQYCAHTHTKTAFECAHVNILLFTHICVSKHAQVNRSPQPWSSFGNLLVRAESLSGLPFFEHGTLVVQTLCLSARRHGGHKRSEEGVIG